MIGNYNVSDGLVLPLLYRPVKHISRLITDRGYRKYHLLASRLGNRPRYRPCTVKLSGLTLDMPDAASFLSTYYELFVEKIYAFTAATASPKILDLGANIGLSVIYFKHLYPKAEITAYEADPRIFRYLERNIHGNGFDDVRLINKAVWNENRVLTFNSEGSDGGRVVPGEDKDLITVQAVDIREILSQERFDFLKMDIEGAEEQVMPACRDHLGRFRHIFIEYHSTAGRRQSLDRLISELAEAGFRIHIHSLMNSQSPFLGIRTHAGFDMQLNIFAWKE